MIWKFGNVYEKILDDCEGGEVFDLDGKQAIVMSGAYSLDKIVRLMYGYGGPAVQLPAVVGPVHALHIRADRGLHCPHLQRRRPDCPI